MLRYIHYKKRYSLILFIALGFSPTETKSQSSVQGKYVAKNNFCTATVLLLPAGLFYYEGGCEERSTILKGAYKVSKDSVQFFADPAAISYKIKTAETNNEDKQTITLLDVEGKPLAFINIFTLSAPQDADTLKYLNHLLTDKNGTLSLENSKVSYISLDRFNPKRISKDNHFKWEPLSALYGKTIQFNYPAFCLTYPEVQVGYRLPALVRKAGRDSLEDDNLNIYIKK